MKLFLNLNPSRGWYWWSLADSFEGPPLLNGPVREDRQECEDEAKQLAASLNIQLVS